MDQDGCTYTIAIRDIQAFEELTYHYGMLETELSLTSGLECKCGSDNCTGKWTFDLYRRNDPFACNLMKYAKPELQAKAERLKNDFWHSDKSYLKRISVENIPITEQQLKLTCLIPIKNGEVVACFIDNNCRQVKYSSDYNCMVVDKMVIAQKDMPAEADITVRPPVNVYCDGVFDLFHLGHQKHLKNCKKLGDRLFVGVVNDEKVQSYKRKPVMNEKERLKVVAAFDSVYQVIPNAPMIVDEDFLNKWNIQVVCISPEYDQEDDEYYAIPRQMGIVKVMSRLGGISTTDLINRIQNIE